MGSAVVRSGVCTNLNVLDKAIELGDRMALAQQGQHSLIARVETKPMMAAKRDTLFAIALCRTLG